MIAARPQLGAARPVLASGFWVDLLAAAALALLAEFEVWVEPVFQTGIPGPRPALAACVLLATAPLAWRRRRPLPVLAVVVAGLVLVGVVGSADQSAFELLLGLLLATYTAAARASARDAAVGAALVLGGGAAYEWATWVRGDGPADIAVPYLFLVGCWGIGRTVHQQRLQARSAVATERARIARELHDVVSHAIGVMGIEAAAVRRSLAPEQAEQRELLLAAERAGREAIGEMQRLLGVLRTNGEDVGLAPLPGLARLPELVDEARRSGLEVDLDLGVEAASLPAALQLTAYRIVQEALTNVRRHARAQSVRVAVRCRDSSLELRVEDDGAGAARLVPGHGLIGMRERVALNGGTLRHGSNGGGGFVVEASLPLEP